MKIKQLLIPPLLSATLFTPQLFAADYLVDDKGAHASINFKIKHMGFSWLTGRFNQFSGKFSYDPANVNAAKIEITVDTSSVDSNHAMRDKHLRSDDFLEVEKFSHATFVSSSVADKGGDKLEVKGKLTLHGISKEITIDAEKIGEGKDPWGGYRVGFSGTTRISLKDFAIKMDLGPDSTHVDLTFHLEGIKQP